MNSIIDFFFKRSPKHSIKAVQEQDFEGYLKSLGLLDIVKNGKSRCQFCGTIVTLDNLEAIAPRDGTITFICQNQKCITQL